MEVKFLTSVKDTDIKHIDYINKRLIFQHDEYLEIYDFNGELIQKENYTISNITDNDAFVRINDATHLLQFDKPSGKYKNIEIYKCHIYVPLRIDTNTYVACEKQHGNITVFGDKCEKYNQISR